MRSLAALTVIPGVRVLGHQWPLQRIGLPQLSPQHDGVSPRGLASAAATHRCRAGAIGAWLSQTLSPGILNWAVVASFALMAGWILVPDRLDANEVSERTSKLGVYSTTALTFFLAEMGDKTQIATIALAARFQSFYAVVAGTTLAMLIANVPVIYFGHRFADRLPARAVHRIACVIFLVLGGLALKNALASAV